VYNQDKLASDTYVYKRNSMPLQPCKTTI